MLKRLRMTVFCTDCCLKLEKTTPVETKSTPAHSLSKTAPTSSEEKKDTSTTQYERKRQQPTQSQVSTETTSKVSKNETAPVSKDEAKQWMAVWDDSTNKYYYWNQVCSFTLKSCEGYKRHDVGLSSVVLGVERDV